MGFCSVIMSAADLDYDQVALKDAYEVALTAGESALSKENELAE